MKTYWDGSMAFECWLTWETEKVLDLNCLKLYFNLVNLSNNSKYDY